MNTRHDRHLVFVVDDEQNVLDTISHILRRDGFDLACARTAAGAFEAVAAKQPCMVLLDVMMPGIDGFTLCRQVAGDPRTAHIPVALVTGRTNDTDVAEGLAAGAVDYIKKPFDRDEFRMRVRSHIRLHESALDRARLVRQLEVVYSAAQDAIIVMTQAGTVRHWNRAAERMFGYRPDEVMGQRLHDVVAPERFRSAHAAAFHQFQENGQGAAIGRTLQLQGLRRDGSEFPVELSLSAAWIDGEWQAVGIVRDVTERLALERQARARLELTKAVLNAIPLPVFCKDRDGRFIGVNPAYERYMGRAEQEVLGLTVADLLPPPEAAEQMARDRALLASPGTIVYDSLVTDGAGRRREVETYKATFTDGDGQVAGIAGALRDVTDRRRLEAELSHTRKLEAVGQLAAGIAHEINTPTQYVGDSLAFLQDAYGEYRHVLAAYRRLAATVGPPTEMADALAAVANAEQQADIAFLDAHIPESFERCADGIGRIATIVRAMKEFAHPDTREPAPADLNQALRSTLTIASHEYKYVADVALDLGDLPPVPCHVGDLNQVFLNLLVNAAHAIADRVAPDQERGVIRVVSRQVDDGVRIDIADTGTGVPEHIRHRVFDPFFTTKPVGKGTGQGLALARTVVVERHRGRIWFETTPGTGTTFSIWLPLQAGSPSSESPRP